MSKAMESVNNMLKIEFTEKELAFLLDAGFNVSRIIDINTASEIVDTLGYNDVGIAADIIIKITTHPDW